MRRIIVINLIFVAFLSGCELIDVQNHDVVEMSYLNKLKEVIDENGNIIPLENDTLFPPYIFIGNFNISGTTVKSDSIFFLKNINGETICKWEITKQISYTKKNNRFEYLLSNNKYFFIECDKRLIFSVSQHVNKESFLSGKLLIGKYTYAGEKPIDW